MRKLTLAQIQEDAARHGGRCLSETYVDSLTLMDWQCAKGHTWRAVAHAVRQGHWCKKCADERLRFPAQAVHDVAAARGGKCLSPYTNSQAKLEWQCGAGHHWHATFNSVKQGSWCPHCRIARRQASAKHPRVNGSGSGIAHAVAMLTQSSLTTE
ncbi:MAG TPA: hypothetical protein VFK84_06585 [Burkholderiales bacterium]|nr:hypothetical protein [Burkholderiales bacterium]